MGSPVLCIKITLLVWGTICLDSGRWSLLAALHQATNCPGLILFCHERNGMGQELQYGFTYCDTVIKTELKRYKGHQLLPSLTPVKTLNLQLEHL